MKVWAFFRRFDEFIHGPEFSIDELYTCIVESSGLHLALIHDIHVALVMIVLDEYDSVEKSDTERHSRLSMYLLTSCKEDFIMQHIGCCWMEVLVDVSKSKKIGDSVDSCHPSVLLM